MFESFVQRLKPQLVFAVIASVFGIVFMVLTPPFQSPDEATHFFKAYQISTGQLVSVKQNDRVGGSLPKSIIRETNRFAHLPGRIHAKTSQKEILGSSQESGSEEKQFVDFPSAAVYSPISYAPQSIVIALAKFFSPSPLFLLYAARFASLLFWVICIFFAIRIMPTFQWLMVALALLPMSIFTHMSVTADVVTNALAFLLIAHFIRSIFSDEKLNRKEFYFLLALSILLASAKLVYAPLIGLFLLIPRKRFTKTLSFWMHFGILVAVNFGTVLCWSVVSNGLYTPHSAYHPEFVGNTNLISCADMGNQLAYILSHGTYIFEVFGRSMVESFSMYYEGFVGTFGWLDTHLPSWIFGVVYLSLFFIALIDGNKEYRFKLSAKFLFAAIILGITCLILLSQHLIWDCVGGKTIGNLQGRYFIPFAPLIFFLFGGNFSGRAKSILPIIVIVLSIGTLTLSSHTIHDRYYTPSKFETVQTVCDHEELLNDQQFKTSREGIWATNAQVRSNETARSGKFSVKLNPKDQFGTLIETTCNSGDVLEIEVWRKGSNGRIVVTANDPEVFYQWYETTDNTNDEWNRIGAAVHIPRGMKNEPISIYLLYPADKDSCYFDDLKIRHHRLQ